jgi:hypothetical protein
VWSRRPLLRGLPIIIENIMNKRNVSLIQRIPKYEEIISKNLNVDTNLGARKGEDALL